VIDARFPLLPIALVVACSRAPRVAPPDAAPQENAMSASASASAAPPEEPMATASAPAVPSSSSAARRKKRVRHLPRTFDVAPTCKAMPPERPDDFAVEYERCTYKPGRGEDCTMFAIVTDTADCRKHDDCFRPSDEDLEALYQEFRRQGFVRIRRGEFTARHSSLRLAAYYAGKGCEVVKSALHGVDAADVERFGQLMDRVLEATQAPLAPVEL
jgi:hypothetical protein